MSECNCASFQPGDLRAILYAAACPVHFVQIFGKPEAEKPRPKACGDCYFWMKSSLCPQERNVNGRNKGPSMNGSICEKFAEAP